MRVLVKWYFNELRGYLIMSFKSIAVTAYENKSECIFSYIEKFYVIIFMKKLLPTENKMILSKSYSFNEIVCWPCI